ncbi:RIP metalloprotease RseP [Dichotomicrobium thermohalophilum]|uniref:Zinc metalloprotease n=1 Tax=Dichotomicrobium thermohalophilum TaxID=933063 RepID=A0A397Q5Q7_9HYPH|nr:RIP metalloprotease RseP [Dichotomicrobium thermohalophilum]RIA56432.1 regulator of sigma E protease [Dichotomicrobium thermohalophilum]
MGIIESLIAFGTTVLAWAIPFLIVLGLVVFIHELGHFLVARMNGVAVEAFSIGFGPEIAGFHDKHGTRWRVAWIPLGGYVKFLGDENAASMPSQEAAAQVSPEDRARMFQFKPVGARALVVAAGPFANFLLALVIFAGLFMAYGKTVIEPRVDEVVAESPAERAGFQPGDLILSIDGDEVESFQEMVRIVGLSADQPLDVVVQRDGARVNLTVTPELVETESRFGSAKIARIGIRGAADQSDVIRKSYGPLEAVGQSFQETWFWMKQPIIFIGELIGGRASADQLGGPVRIAQMSKEVASIGIPELLRWTAIISISIGLINLFPIPVLDGGHLVFYGIEAIRGKPLNEKAQEIGFRIGMALVLMLMIFVTWNDVMQLIE